MTPFTTKHTHVIDGVRQYRHQCNHCRTLTAWTTKALLHCSCRDAQELPVIECVHRGEIIGAHICNTCGNRGAIAQVYQCQLLQQPCVLRPWTTNKSKMPEVSCVTCRQRELTDGTKPWDALS
jgi:hypothetical protein